ncbi:hypothetical protein ACLFLT_24595 [Klebsiella pneumoniae]
MHASTPGANLPWAKPRRKRSIPKQPLTKPPAAGGSLETVIAEQMAWITAWRIDRYARGSMLKTPFYQRATNTEEALPAARKAAEVIRDKEQEKVLSARQNQIANQSPDRMDELVCSRA